MQTAVQPKVTAIVTAWKRVEQTLATIAHIRACDPAPDEILVHVDAGGEGCASAIRKAFPDIAVLESASSVGPGGGRNKLAGAARNEFVASFDDDSYPIDADYFARAVSLFQRFPEAALIAASIYHRHETQAPAARAAALTASFTGCGVVYRRGAFLAGGGYVPLPIAYAMEEEDLALRLLDQGKVMLYSPWLRVFHDTDLSHHGNPRITAGQIANTALLAFLRYPPRYWPYGAAQVLNRALWSVRNGRSAGVLSGLGQIPGHLWRHRSLRRAVSAATLRGKLRSRALALESF
jgi:GT2 family glycosyltransferase